MLAVGALFAGGTAFIGVLALVPAQRTTALAFAQLLAQEALIVAPVLFLSLATVWVPGWIAAIVLGAFVLRAVFEIRDAWPASHAGRAGLLLLCAWSAVFVTTAWHLVAGGTATLLLLVYIIVEFADSAALLIGRLAGRTHPFPRLSPNKTTAGCVAGLGAGAVLGAALAWGVAGMAPVSAIGFALLVVLCGFAGDLALSAVKRRLMRKDFRPLLARHGGALDIYDSFVVAVPPAALVAAVLS